MSSATGGSRSGSEPPEAEPALRFWGGLCLAPDPALPAFGDLVANAAWERGLLPCRLLPGAYARLRALARQQGRSDPFGLEALEWELRGATALLAPAGVARLQAGGNVPIALEDPDSPTPALDLLRRLGLGQDLLAGLSFRAVDDPGPSDLDDLLYEESQLGSGPPLPELLPLRIHAASWAGVAPEAGRLGGAILGPLLALFADWILEGCRREGIGHIFPIMREGRILAEFLERAARARGLAVQIHPLHLSRRATLAARAGGEVRTWLALFLDGRGLTLDDVFRVVGLRPGGSWLAAHGAAQVREASGYRNDEGDDLRQALLGWLGSDQVQELLVRRLASEQEGLRGYLARHLPEGLRFATVDSGCRGTINAALERTLPYGAPRPVHFLLVGTDATSDLVLGGMDIRGYLAGAGGCLDLARGYARSPDPIEQLLMDDDGTTTGYRLEPDGWVPVQDPCPCQPPELQRKRDCRAAAAVFQAAWLSASQAQPLALAHYLERREDLGLILARLLLLPSAAEADLLGNLSTDENAGAQTVASICDPVGARELARLGPDRFLEATRYAFEPAQVRWPQGTLTRLYPGFLRAALLRARESFPFPAGRAWFETAYQEVADSCREARGALCIYGAGPVGRAFLAVARRSGLDIAGFTDSNPASLGLTLACLPVRSLEATLALGISRFVCASFEHGPAMAQSIQSAAGRMNVVPSIWILGQRRACAEEEA